MSKWQFTWDFHVDLWPDVLDQMIWSLQTLGFPFLNQGHSVTMLELWKMTPCGKAWSQSLQVQKSLLPVLSFCRSLASKKDCYKHMLATWAELNMAIWKMAHMGNKSGGKTWGAQVIDEKKEEWEELREKWQNSQSGHQRLQKNKRWEHGQ